MRVYLLKEARDILGNEGALVYEFYENLEISMIRKLRQAGRMQDLPRICTLNDSIAQMARFKDLIVTAFQQECSMRMKEIDPLDSSSTNNRKNSSFRRSLKHCVARFRCS